METGGGGGGGGYHYSLEGDTLPFLFIPLQSIGILLPLLRSPAGQITIRCLRKRRGFDQLSNVLMNNGETSERNADRKRGILFLPTRIQGDPKMQFPDLTRRHISLPFFQPFRFIHAERKRKEKRKGKKRGGGRRVTGQFTQLNNTLGLNFHSAVNNSLFCSSMSPVLEDKTDHPQLVTTCWMI